MHTIKKQSYEEFYVWGNFARPEPNEVGLGDGENLDATAISDPPNSPDGGAGVYYNHVVAVDADGNDAPQILEDESLLIDGQKLGIRVKDGISDESPYKLTFRSVAEDGQRFEIDVKVKIKNI